MEYLYNCIRQQIISIALRSTDKKAHVLTLFRPGFFFASQDGGGGGGEGGVSGGPTPVTLQPLIV